MSLMDDVREVVANQQTGEGYVIAFPSQHTDAVRPEMRLLFAKPFGVNGELRGGLLSNATFYPTYQAAAEAAASWNWTGGPLVRIVHVKRRLPFEILGDFSPNLLDAIAEA